MAENIFEDLIRENNIPVYRDEWLDRESGVEVNTNSIVSLTTLSGKKFSGKMFIDATCEGDLMAAAGVSYTIGREPCAQYNEAWNGYANMDSSLQMGQIIPFQRIISIYCAQFHRNKSSLLL